MTSQAHAELAAERDRLAAAHRAALDALELERLRTASLRAVLEWVWRELPSRRDWLNPDCERAMRDALASVKAEPS